MLSFPRSSVGKESACNSGDPGLIPGLWRSPGEGNGNPLWYSCLKNPMDRGAWQAIVHGVTRVRHDLATKPPLFNDREKATFLCDRNILYLIGMQHMYIFVYSLNVRCVHFTINYFIIKIKCITHYWTFHYTPERRNTAPSTRTSIDTSFPNQETLTSHLYKPTHSEEMPQ